MNTMFIALQAAGAAQQQGSSWSMIIMMVLIFVVMWLFMIRPQQKQQKELNKFRESLAKGQKIVTAGGIYGTVTGLKDDTVTLAVGAQKTSMVFARWAIRSVEDAPLENDSEALV